MATRIDGMLDGRLRLGQATDGYRAGMDAALLAAACKAARGERVLEAGSGAGAALLAAALRNEGACFVGVEKDPAALALARENIGRNGLEARVEAVGGDIAAPFAALSLAPFDQAIANPPFFDDETALRPPAARRRASLIAQEPLAAWAKFLLAAVREGGVIVLIHRADRLADILAAFSRGAGSLQIRPVQPFAQAPAKRIVVRAVRSGRAPLQLLPALVLHAAGDGKHTPAAEAILRGRAALEWS